MKQIEQTGKTISEAVETACAKLGVGLTDIDYEIIDEGSKGIFGFGAKPAKVLVTCAALDDEVKKESKPVKKEFKREAKKAEPKPVKKAEPKPAVKPEPIVKAEPKPEPVKAEEPTVAAPEEEVLNERANLTEADKANIINTALNFLREIFKAMDMDIDFDTDFADNKQIIIELKGDDMGAIIGKRGQTLDSLQYLTNLVVNKGEYPYMNVTLDTEGYRARRKETLERLAFNLAKKAKHNRRNVSLEPMNPYERRIIHSTLQNDRYVTTYSEGTEPYRYVVIALKNSYGSRRSHY